MTSLQQTAMGGGSATAKTASYVLVAADAGTSVLMNSASSTTITVNTALFAAGDTVYIQNIGAGVSTITAGTATVTTSASLALAQWEGGTLYFTSASAAIFLKGAGAAVASGASLLAQKISGNYYRSITNATPASATVANFFQATYYTPVYLPTGTADTLIVRTGAGFTGTSTARIGIYNNSDGLPTTVLVDGGTVSATAANTVYSITISTAVTAGWYWLACNATDSGGTNTWIAFDWSVTTTRINGFLGSVGSSNVAAKDTLAYYQTGVTGAFATAGTLVALTSASIAPMVRVS
jgi:hypothetical protein